MKREGRQHGTVISYDLLSATLSHQRLVKMVDSAAVTGFFTKVPTKPTNHSKFTGKCFGKCRGCHARPVCKSKAKAKGTMKLRSIDDFTKYSAGASAAGVLAYLDHEGGGYDYDDGEYGYEGMVEDNDDYGYGYGYGYGYDDVHDDDGTHDIDLYGGLRIGIEIGASSVVAEEHENDDGGIDDDDDDDNMSFCDVGLCWGHDEGDEYGDDGWYLVGGLML